MTSEVLPPSDKYVILHIDDESEQLFFAKTFLEEADSELEIVSVRTADDLMKHLDTCIDCIVSDYVMPDVNGMDLCKRVKRVQDIPFIMYTGRGSEVVAEAAFQAGVDDYVRKEADPSHYQLLARRIKSHAESHRRKREESRYQKRLEGVREILPVISSANTMEDVTTRTLNVLDEIMGYRNTCFWLINDYSADPVKRLGDSPELSLGVDELKDGITQRLLDDGYVLVVPLFMDVVYGYLTAYQATPFSQTDYPLMEAISLLVGQAVNRVKQVETISASEKQFRNIVENVQDVIVLTKPEGSINYISPSAEIFHYKPSKLVDHMWGELVVSEDLGKIAEFYNSSLAGNKGKINEYRIQGGDGEVYWVSHSWAPVVVDGVVKHVVSAVNDITWRKRIETTLYTSLEELEKANRDLNDFTHIVSHDLKAPLMTIESFSDFLLEDYFDVLDETGQEYLDSILKASNNMRELIDNLLTLSRVGRINTEYSKVDLNVLLAEIKEELKPQIDMKQAIVTGNNLPELVTQRTWIKQVLMNLIGNGIKFNETNPPRVEITYTETETGYQFKVRDNGIGIPEDQHEHLFKLFQRLEHTNHYPGTGAGLSICKKIIESLGGEIWVESQEGYGSSFIFTVPDGAVEEDADSQVGQAVHVDGLVER
ncbi:MAG: ATP-binding protein [Candidatus Bathyarchaeota archaeon]|nr:ATP-binding protein [Candidatus Bathyarchaeota archaeon]